MKETTHTGGGGMRFEACSERGENRWVTGHHIRRGTYKVEAGHIEG